MAYIRRRRWRYDASGWVITGCISRIAVVVVVVWVGQDKRLMKPKPVMKWMMAERAVYKLASEAAVISEGHASGGHAYCAEA